MRRLAWRLWLPAVLVILWQLACSAGLLNPLFVPAPSTLLPAAARMAASGELARNVGATLGRMGAGFLIGSVFGLGTGLLMGSSPRMRQSLEPMVSALNATPKLSIFPLALLLFGVGETARIGVIALGCLIIMSMHAFDAVSNIHSTWVDMAVNYGARKRSLFAAVYVPACLPQIFTGLRVAMGNALVIAVAAEMVTPSVGLGSMIWLAWQTFSVDRLYIAVLLTAILGSMLHEVLLWLEKRIVPWKVPNAGS